MTPSALALAVGDYASARAGLEPLAASGDAEAECALGELYQFGRGVTANREQAKAWYERAAGHGSHRAEFRLGLLAFDRSSDESYFRTLDGAVAWISKAAAAGFTPAQYSLCTLSEPNAAAAGDPSSRREWCEKAAAKGYAKAEYELAKMYDQGVGGPKDSAKALALYRRAAEGGQDAALLDIETLVGPEAKAAVVADYVDRAGQGDVGSQALLGSLYDHGDGVPEDKDEAVKWWSKAAAAGNADAAAQLGVMYATGQAGPRDHLRAYMWFSLAGYRYDDIDVREELINLRDDERRYLTSEQLREAWRIIAEKLD
jgi:TPR repeat protein